jgi:hypothetical protein
LILTDFQGLKVGDFACFERLTVSMKVLGRECLLAQAFDILTRGSIWALAKVLDLARAPRRTARKKGSGYENAAHPRSQCFSAACVAFSYPEPFLRAVRRRALAKSKTGYHKNMVKEYIRY